MLERPKSTHSIQSSYAFFLPRLRKAINWPIEPRLYIKDLRLETNFGQVEWVFKNFRHHACNLHVLKKRKKKKKKTFKL